MKTAFVLGICLLAAPVSACPAGADISQPLDRIYAQMAVAPNEATSQGLAGALWVLWLQAPDARAQDLLDRGMALRERGDYRDAEIVLTELVTYCPDYAEGWNQRAFARYLQANFEAALPDLERTLELRPRHLGALSGKALTHVAMGQGDMAIPLIRRMVRLNPWARERDMIEDFGTEL
ncbi:MAG: hypothetical protein AAF386_11030 [Pseudomonadota bacterium]